MPRPRPKKIVTARPAPVARHHSTTSIKSGLTVNGPVNDEAPITASGDELPRQTRLGSRVKRTLSKKTSKVEKPVARQDQESEPGAEDDVSGGEHPEEGGEAVTETLVQATPEDVLIGLEEHELAANATETGTLNAPSTGGRGKRLKEKAADVVRRVSTRRHSRHVSGPVALESQAEPEEHLPSSPPLYAQAPASVARIQATPSFLTNFRKQPRQPSILRMVQQSVGVLGSDDEDLTFGDETDLLADITTTTAPAPGQSKVQDDEGLYDEVVPPVLSSSSRKRKASMLGLDNEEVIPSSIRGPPIHRHDATALPSDPASLPETAQIPSDPTDELSPDDSASHKAARSSPPLEDNPQSDALPSPRKNVRPRRPGRVRGQKSTAKLVLPVIHSSSSIIEASSPHSTPPSSPINTQAQQAQNQKSKATTATRKGSKREKVVAVTTAALQALLPKRKVDKTARTRDTFDIHSSSTEPSNEDAEIDEEEDELSRPARRRAQETQPPRAKPGALKSPKAIRGKAVGHILMTKSVTTKQARAKQSPVKASTGRVSKTYARQSRSEQENDDDANEDEVPEDDLDDTIVTADGQVQGGELKNVRKKFEQVDQWELEFESADVGGDSSPWR